MKGKVYAVPNDEIKSLKAQFEELDKKLQVMTEKKDVNIVTDVLELQQKIADYLANKKVLGELLNSKQSINDISVKYGMALSCAEIEEAMTFVNPEMKSVLEIAKAMDTAIAIEVY